MFFLLFLMLAGCAVKCDHYNNYYVIQMPDDPIPRIKKPFQAYWNVPTKQCKSKKIPFENMYERFGIIQNENDSFLGDKISILYDPGQFPALFKDDSGKFRFRNGGVPQEGDIDVHLAAFRDDLDKNIPDVKFNGVGIIDFESWRPVFRQNFGELVPYKDVSYQMEKKMHWWWPLKWQQVEAKQRFEEAGRRFMQTTLSVAKQLRPQATWGYYAYPYCFNMASNNMVETCSDQVKEENDDSYWLWSESTSLFPSVYSSKELTSSQLASLIRGRVREAQRVKRGETAVLPYFWYRYREGGFLSEDDLNTALKTMYQSNASGFIIWGSSSDVNTKDKCNALLNYIENTMGPAIAKYTKHLNRFNDEILEEVSESTTEDNAYKINATDPEYHWTPPDNYTEDIVKYVEEEMKSKADKNDSIATNKVVNIGDSVLLEMILRDLLFSPENETNAIENLMGIEVSTEAADTTTFEASTNNVRENYFSTTNNIEGFESTTIKDEITTELFEDNSKLKNKQNDQSFFNENTFFDSEQQIMQTLDANNYMTTQKCDPTESTTSVESTTNKGNH